MPGSKINRKSIRRRSSDTPSKIYRSSIRRKSDEHRKSEIADPACTEKRQSNDSIHIRLDSDPKFLHPPNLVASSCLGGNREAKSIFRRILDGFSFIPFWPGGMSAPLAVGRHGMSNPKQKPYLRLENHRSLTPSRFPLAPPCIPAPKVRGPGFCDFHFARHAPSQME